MSFELNSPAARVLYLNFRQLGDGKLETEAEQIFTFSSLIEDSSKYVVSIERFRIPIQSIPMQDQINNAVILHSKTGGPDVFITSIISFGLYDWLLQLNRGGAGSFEVNLTADGRIQIFNFNFDDFSIELDPKVANIFNLPILVDGAGVQSVVGGVPIFDVFDQLFKIQVEALNGLGNLQQEIIDTNIFTTLLTDFIIPSDFSMSVTNALDMSLNNNVSFTLPVRQDLEFNASQARRLINFRGSSPIQNVKVRVTAIYRDGSRHAIIIPPNGVFELKLAFFRKDK